LTWVFALGINWNQEKETLTINERGKIMKQTKESFFSDMEKIKEDHCAICGRVRECKVDEFSNHPLCFGCTQDIAFSRSVKGGKR
jgi:hypothetical protein